ncbi:MAG: peptide deformylase [Maritimibacter sp.]|nr:peptide deformylase [Maritimibacter sp.]
MSRLPIRLWGDPVLRGIARPVGEITDEIRTLAADLAETMYDAPGRGLAAPQVGVPLRMFVMDCHWKDDGERDPVVVIDPEILDASDETATHEEGCLSIPDVPVSVTRPAEITLRWRGLDGVPTEQRLSGMEAICAQHEFDHLDGKLIPDVLDPDARAEADAVLAALADRAAQGQTE